MDPSDNMESSDSDSVGVNGGGVATLFLFTLQLQFWEADDVLGEGP